MGALNKTRVAEICFRSESTISEPDLSSERRLIETRLAGKLSAPKSCSTLKYSIPKNSLSFELGNGFCRS